MTIATRSLAIVIAIVTSTTVAHAQKAEAETLFREGKKLMKKGSLAAACEKFEASERLDPAIGTELNLADCRQKNGQLASAWAMFVKAAQTGKHTARGVEAKNRATALASKLVSLTISVPDKARIDGLVIKRNDVVVDPGAFDTAVPVDPDDYVITAEAPGHEHWKQSVTVGKKNKTVEVPRLDDLPPPPPEPKPSPVVVVQPKPVEPPKPATPAEPSSFTPTRKFALAIGLLGLATGGGGVVLGLQAKDNETQSDAICPTSRCTDPDAFDLNKQARDKALYSNIGMISGGALVAGALVLWFVGGPSHGGVAIAPTIGTSSIGIAGRF